MELLLKNDRLVIGDKIFRCAVGRNGISMDKKEADGCTPVGTFYFREVFYRADRIAEPPCQLPIRALTQSDGWCDDSADPNYNCFVKLPYAASHEELWLQDHRYDLIVVIGYNDNPIRPGDGSAIFMHVVLDDYVPTSGCIALAMDDLLAVVKELTPQTTIRIEEVVNDKVKQEATR